MVHKAGKSLDELSHIELVVTQTSKVNPKSNFEAFNQEKKSFRSMAEANAWITEQYGKKKKQPMYVDSPSGKPTKVGFIVGFRNKDYDRDTGKWVNFIEQDWIEFRKVTPFEVRSRQLWFTQ
jgi:hypothetical protein